MDSHLVIVALVAYLLGSIPFGYILVKLFLKQDIRQTGSGNIGATNVARSGRKGLALATLLLDAGKGATAVFVGLVLDSRFLDHFGGQVVSQPPGHVHDHLPVEVGTSMALAALFAVIGHCFPAWLAFKGGKGVATAIGAFAVIVPGAALIAVVSFGVIFALTRYVSLSSVLAAAVFPVAAYFSVQPRYELSAVVLMAASSLIIILKHHANIRRLLAGTEPRFGQKAIGTTDPIQAEKSI